MESPPPIIENGVRYEFIMENIEKAKSSGNVLTQTMDEDGNLVGVKETVDFDSREPVIETAQLRDEVLADADKESGEKE